MCIRDRESAEFAAESSFIAVRKPLIAPPRSEPKFLNRLVPKTTKTMVRMINSSQMLSPNIVISHRSGVGRNLVVAIIGLAVPFFFDTGHIEPVGENRQHLLWIYVTFCKQNHGMKP